MLNLISKMNKAIKFWRYGSHGAQVVELLLRKHKVLSSNFSTAKCNKRKLNPRQSVVNSDQLLIFWHCTMLYAVYAINLSAVCLGNATWLWEIPLIALMLVMVETYTLENSKCYTSSELLFSIRPVNTDVCYKFYHFFCLFMKRRQKGREDGRTASVSVLVIMHMVIFSAGNYDAP